MSETDTPPGGSAEGERTDLQAASEQTAASALPPPADHDDEAAKRLLERARDLGINLDTPGASALIDLIGHVSGETSDETIQPPPDGVQDWHDPPPQPAESPESFDDRVLLWRTKIYDSASPFAGRYLDDRSDDPLAIEARRALQHARKENSFVFHGTKDTKVGPCYFQAEQGTSPSVVFHAMAAGLLLELGYAPGAPCVAEHLRILGHRLRAIESANPEDPPGGNLRHSWFLRTRHVAWALAMLAEIPSWETPADADPMQFRWMEFHRTLAERAYDYLDGGRDAPSWIGLRTGETWWSEYWRPTSETGPDGAPLRRFDREPNLLNTIYAALAIARATRHDLGAPAALWSRRRHLPSQILGELADRIRIEITEQGPRTRLGSFDRRAKPAEAKTEAPTTPEAKRKAKAGTSEAAKDDPPGSYSPWQEKWAQGDKNLPPGVVGLLCIFLLEYAYTISQNEGQQAGRPYLLKAQRLAHDLLSRPNDWIRSIELYTWDPTPRKAAPNWQIFAYSVCLRAILEAGVVGTTHVYLLEAFQTIQASQQQIEPPGGTPFTTWVDVGLPFQNKPYEGEDWFERIPIHTELGLRKPDFRDRNRGASPAANPETEQEVKKGDERSGRVYPAHLVPEGKPCPEDFEPTPHAIHSAMMAWAAVRRALWREDPRETVVRGRSEGHSALQHLLVPGRLPDGRKGSTSSPHPMPNFDTLELEGDLLSGAVGIRLVSTGARSESFTIKSGVALVLLALSPDFAKTNTDGVLKVLRAWKKRRLAEKGASIPFDLGLSKSWVTAQTAGLCRSVGCLVVVNEKGHLSFAPQLTRITVDAVRWAVPLEEIGRIKPAPSSAEPPDR